MGLFNSLFGSSGKNHSTSTGTQDTTQNATTSQKGTGTQTSSVSTQTLSPEILSLLESVTKNQAGNLGMSVDANTVRELVSQLENNSDPNLVASGIKAQQDVARMDFAKTEGANINQLQQQIGGKGNSFSALVQQQGEIDLSKTLADIGIKGMETARAQRATELGGAIAGTAQASNLEAQPMQQFLSLIAALEGAQSNQTGETTTIQDMLQTLNGKTNTKSTGEQFGGAQQTQGLFPTIASLF